MEVAGVVLGAIPIIIYALERYSDTRDVLMGFRRWSEALGTLKSEIFLQKRQLSLTLHNIGIELTDRTTMADVKAVLQLTHPSQCEDIMRLLRQMDSMLNDIAANLLDIQGPPTWDDAKSDRMSWEWRRVSRSFKKKKSRQMFDQLQDWNTKLRYCSLERREALPDTESRVVEALRKTFDEEKTRSIRDNAHAVHKAFTANLGCTCVDGHRGSIRLNWHSDRVAVTSEFHLALSKKTISTPSVSTSANVTWSMVTIDVEPSVTQQSAPTKLPFASSAKQCSLSVLQSSGGNVRPAPTKKTVSFKTSLLQKTKTVPAKSPAALNSTICIVRNTSSAPPVTVCRMAHLKHNNGAVIGSMAIPGSDPSQQLRILAESNPSTGGLHIRRVIRLHAALSRATDSITNRKLGLDRKRRFGIAAALTWAVLHLCDSPWFETTLDHDDIHLFLDHEQGKPTSQLSKHPYIAYNFQLPASHPVSSPQASSHPAGQFQSNQIQNMALYTLAIRLIELGVNKPFAQIRNEYHASTASTQPSQPNNPLDDFEIARHQISELELDPGATYANAADRCLRCLFPGSSQSNTFQFSAFRKIFFADVVAPVQATFELIPDSASMFAA